MAAPSSVLSCCAWATDRLAAKNRPNKLVRSMPMVRLLGPIWGTGPHQDSTSKAQDQMLQALKKRLKSRWRTGQEGIGQRT
jgi:hypothetical protein